MIDSKVDFTWTGHLEPDAGVGGSVHDELFGVWCGVNLCSSADLIARGQVVNKLGGGRVFRLYQRYARQKTYRRKYRRELQVHGRYFEAHRRLAGSLSMPVLKGLTSVFKMVGRKWQKLWPVLIFLTVGLLMTCQESSFVSDPATPKTFHPQIIPRVKLPHTSANNCTNYDDLAKIARHVGRPHIQANGDFLTFDFDPPARKYVRREMERYFKGRNLIFIGNSNVRKMFGKYTTRGDEDMDGGRRCDHDKFDALRQDLRQDSSSQYKVSSRGF